MSSVKKLAGQTLWYGVSSIAARFINYLLTPYLTLHFTTATYGEINLLYSAIPFFMVVFTYGMETAYFRFYNQKQDRNAVYNTASISLIVSTFVFTGLLVVFKTPLVNLLEMQAYPEMVTIAALIIGLDTLAVIPFARLRQDGRPMKYALVRVGGICVNIFFVYFFIGICPAILQKNPNSLIGLWYRPAWGVGYVFLANLIQSVVSLLLLQKEFFGFKWQFDKKLWREMLLFGLPLIIAGMGGIINETFDRMMLLWWAPVANATEAKAQVGIYSACYKLSILITLAVQAFRMGAEPFFFKQAGEVNAKRTYARVMKFFVITLCGMFLMVMLFLNEWKVFIQNPAMHEGLKILPILLLANIFLGIYYNLSIWYKLDNRTMIGAYITLIGAAITLLINAFFIPYYGYMACAWATFACYATMMVISYGMGQKSYPVPYAPKKLIAYLLIAVGVYLLHRYLSQFLPTRIGNNLTGLGLLILYLAFIMRVERREMANLPVVGRFFKI